MFKIVVSRPVESLRPDARNARTHSKQQVRQIADSIIRFGFTNPILVSADGEVIAGHGRLEAAKLLELESVPTICLSHLSDEERRAYLLADNKLALNAGWDINVLATELEALSQLNFELGLTGFSTAEMDAVLVQASAAAADAFLENDELAPPLVPVTRSRDIWQLGEHRVICGDARDPLTFEELLQGEKVDLIFTDPPYNLAAEVRGVAQVKHRAFTMAAGEMSEEEFTAFLVQTLGHSAASSRDGAIAFVFIDWRHMFELQAAGRQVFTELKNMCVWNKPAGGLGKFYRSKHELIFVFKVGTARHVNNFGLGGGGRYRTNVWDYESLSGFRDGRGDELAMHPTVKPVPLVADAIKDCSHRDDVVLDPFGGSGTTLIAAETVSRRGRLIEVDPGYCDTIVGRYEKLTGGQAILASNGSSFQEIAQSRLSEMGEAV